MMVESDKLESACRIAPGSAMYIVVLPFKHETLKCGDRVKMVEVGSDNLLVRDDLTVHPLQHDSEYVVLMPEGMKIERTTETLTDEQAAFFRQAFCPKEPQANAAQLVTQGQMPLATLREKAPAARLRKILTLTYYNENGERITEEYQQIVEER